MQISDTATLKTGLACSKIMQYCTFNMAKPPFAVGNKVVSKLKATYGTEGEYCRFLEARGVETTLSDGAVEQYPRRRQMGMCYAHVPVLPQKRSACTVRKRQAKQRSRRGRRMQSQQKKRVESILDFQLICQLHSGTYC